MLQIWTGTEKVEEILDTATGLWLCFFLSLTGMFTNSICVIVFWHQRLQESVTLCLASIAVADLLKCFASVLHSLYGCIAIFDRVLSLNWMNASFIVKLHVQYAADTLAYLYTTVMSFERCLCITFPLKVRSLITRKVTMVTIVSTTAVVLATYFYTAISYEVTWEYRALYNRTMATYKETGVIDRVWLLKYVAFINVFWPCLALSVSVICAVIIMVYLKNYGQFRMGLRKYFNGALQKDRCQVGGQVQASCYGEKSSISLKSEKSSAGFSFVTETKASRVTSTSDSPKRSKTVHISPEQTARLSRWRHISSKDSQLLKMLLIIVLLYVINIMTRLAANITWFVEPQFSLLGKYKQEYKIMVDVVFTVDFVNSSTNLFVYLAMSSHFRESFQKLFCCISQTK